MAKPSTVTPAACRMAWKMVDTIFPRHSVSAEHAERLLNLLTAVALEHLTDVESLRWRATTVDAGSLRMTRHRVWLEDASDSILKAAYAETDLDPLLDEAEELLDLYRLDEEEKATLFTALPCLGLSVLQEGFVEWRESPPFVELG